MCLHATSISLVRGLDPKYLHHLGQVFRPRPSPRERGVIKKCVLTRRSLDGSRRSLASAGGSLNRNRQVTATRAASTFADRGDRGVALVMTLLLTGLLSALGLALAVLSTVDTWLSAGLRTSQELSYAADAAVARVQVDLRATNDWTALLVAAVTSPPSAFKDDVLVKTLVDGTTVDLVVQTQRLQSETDARFGSTAANADSPQWRLFAHAPLADLVPGSVAFSSIYVATWIADDPGDGDADASVDANGRLMIRATAFGPGSARRSVEALVGRVGPTGAGAAAVRMLSWRELR
jgi:hypothetical protein